MLEHFTVLEMLQKWLVPSHIAVSGTHRKSSGHGG